MKNQRIISILSLIISLIIFKNTIYAQQQELYALYMFDQQAYNPAYMLNKNAILVNLHTRNQWLSAKGAPTTNGVNIRFPFLSNNISVGFGAIDDRIGSIRNTNTSSNFSYRLTLNRKCYVSMGLSPSIDFYTANYRSLIATDVTDITYQTVQNRTLFNIGSGVYFSSKKFYAGFSIPKMLKNNLGETALQTKHYFFNAGARFEFNDDVIFKPSFIIRSTTNAPISIDFNANFTLINKLWFGAMYRLKEGLGATVGFKINNEVTFAYSYNFSTTKIRLFNIGSHELLLGYALPKKNRKGKRKNKYRVDNCFYNIG